MSFHRHNLDLLPIDYETMGKVSRAHVGGILLKGPYPNAETVVQINVGGGEKFAEQMLWDQR